MALKTGTVVAALTALVACQSGPSSTSRSFPSTSSTAASAQTSASSSSAPAPSADEPALTSLRDLARSKASYSALRNVVLIAETDEFQRFRVEFVSDGRTVTGTLTLPTGMGPFPAIVSIHGYLPPRLYRIGQGLVREEEIFAENGFAVLHPDLSGYGGSSSIAPLEQNLGLAYAQDVINAVHVVKGLEDVDPARVALVGRSMGGSIALTTLVTHPHLVCAAVLFSPVSSRFQDNLRVLHIDRSKPFAHFMQERSVLEAPWTTYRRLSPRSRFGRIAVPVLIDHGTADDVVPPAWSARTVELLRSHAVEASLVLYPGEGHVFQASLPEAAQNAVDFLNRWV